MVSVDMQALKAPEVELSDAMQEKAVHTKASYMPRASWLKLEIVVFAILASLETLVFQLMFGKNGGRLEVLVVLKEPTTMLGFALGFLLVFRSNIAYGRFWEARGHVGGFCKSVRSLAILTSYTSMCTTIAAGAEHEKKGMRDFKIEFNRLLNLSLKTFCLAMYGQSTNDIPQTMLKGDDASRLTAVPSPTLMVIKWMTQAFEHQREAQRIDIMRSNEFTAEFTNMVQAYAGASKIKGTPFPQAYRQLANLFLFVWCITTPVFLASVSAHSHIDLFGIVSTFLLVFFYCSLNEIAVQMEDPFGTDSSDIPLATLFVSCSKDVAALMEEPFLPSFIKELES